MHPHPDPPAPQPLNCALLTLSDSRDPSSDRSGQLLQTLLTQAGHQILDYQILPDEPQLIRTQLGTWGENSHLQVIICNGGTGISPRDVTYEVVNDLLEKTLPGFGELFRFLSYQEIGSRAIASRALAGTYQQKLLFSLPGSTGAVKLALEKLILPELNHLIALLSK